MVSCFPAVWAPASLSYFTAVASLVLCIVVIIGNSLIVLAVIVDPLRKLRTPFSYFLVNLAVSDFIVGILVLPTSFAAHLNEANGHVPSYQVILIHVTYFVSTTASVLSLSALSLDRFVAIKWPIRYRKSLRLSRCVAISAFIWIFSSSISMIYLKVGYIDYLMVFAHVSIIITFTILVFTYRQVYRTLSTQSMAFRNPRNAPEGQEVKGENRFDRHDYRKISVEKKVTRAFLYILGLFICSYVPAIIMIYILQFCTQCDCLLRHVLRDLQFIFVAANSAMNPFVCGIRLQAFRSSIISIMSCRKKAKECDMNMGNPERRERKGRSETVTSTTTATNVSSS